MQISPLDHNYYRPYRLEGHAKVITVVSKDIDFTLGQGVEFVRAWLAKHSIDTVDELDKLAWILTYDPALRLDC